MDGPKKILKKNNVLAFATGIAAAVIAPKVVKSESARKAAVNVVAKGMKFQEDAVTAFEEIKEDAQDVAYEAKEKNKADAGADA